MSLVAAYAVPHPPLIVPSVGRGEEQGISDTIAAYQEVARRIAAHRPDVIVVTSPHAPLYRDGFFVSDGAFEEGSMAQFRAPQERLYVPVDQEFAAALQATLQHEGVPTGGAPRGQGAMDHATFVPLYFIGKELSLEEVPVVRLGLSGLPAEEHRRVGRAIAKVAGQLGRRLVLVASGDMSHKLKADGPYGFDAAGPQFDAQVAEIFKDGQLSELFQLDERMCDDAAECGLRSFQIMAGALDGSAFEAELLSYEGPFGVGYGVAAFEVVPTADDSDEEAAKEMRIANQRARLDERRRDGAEDEEATESGTTHPATRGHQEGSRESGRFGAAREEGQPANGWMEHDVDPLVALARQTVETYVRTGRKLSVPAGFPEKYLNRRAGTFVSLHEHDELRGCIGTIGPVRESIAREVIENAVAAATEDPRFPAVRPDELDFLSYSVDVLGDPEPIDSLIQLDPKRYGVIVSRGWRRGLLLPDLEGVDTAIDQVAIAKRKAGIYDDAPVKLERFEVVRHSAGGEARR